MLYFWVMCFLTIHILRECKLSIWFYVDVMQYKPYILLLLIFLIFASPDTFEKTLMILSRRYMTTCWRTWHPYHPCLMTYLHLSIIFDLHELSLQDPMLLLLLQPSYPGAGGGHLLSKTLLALRWAQQDPLVLDGGGIRHCVRARLKSENQTEARSQKLQANFETYKTTALIIKIILPKNWVP